MTENRASSQMILPGSVRFCVALVSCAVALLSGCSMRKRPAISWTKAIQARPVTQPRATVVRDIPAEEVPDLRFELPSFPLRLLATHTVPPRPHANGSTSSGGSNDAERVAAPLIATQLTKE